MTYSYTAAQTWHCDHCGGVSSRELNYGFAGLFNELSQLCFVTIDPHRGF